MSLGPDRIDPGLHPLRNRTAIVAVYDTQRISDQEMVDTLPILTRLPVAGDAVVSPLRPGVQKRPWIGNCVAVGEAAVILEPLDAVQLHLTHMCVSHLVTLFPVTADEFPEATAYSSSIRSLAANLRFRWEYEPGSELFVVYSDAHDTSENSPGAATMSPQTKTSSTLVA